MKFMKLNKLKLLIPFNPVILIGRYTCSFTCTKPIGFGGSGVIRVNNEVGHQTCKQWLEEDASRVR